MTQANPTVTAALVLQGLQADPAKVFRDVVAALGHSSAPEALPDVKRVGDQTLAALRGVPADVLACIQQGAGGVALAVRANVLEEVLDGLPPHEAARLVEGYLTPATVGGLLEVRGENGSILGAVVALEFFVEAVRTVMLAAAAEVGLPKEDEDGDEDEAFDEDEDDGTSVGGSLSLEEDGSYRPTRAEQAAYAALLPLFVSQCDRPDLQALLAMPLEDGYTFGQYVAAAMACETPYPDPVEWIQAGFEDPEDLKKILRDFEASGWPPVPGAGQEALATLPGAAAPALEAGELKADF